MVLTVKEAEAHRTLLDRCYTAQRLVLDLLIDHNGSVAVNQAIESLGDYSDVQSRAFEGLLRLGSIKFYDAFNGHRRIQLIQQGLR
jgi:hypothetical protein